MDVPFGRRKTGDALDGTLAFPPSAMAAPISRYAPGAILSGKYRLETMLGEGGMGAVWRASNLLLDLPVAIKLIRADLDRTVLRARLQVEARSTAKLGHPAIVRVYDVGESELGDPFIVMELMHGQTLAKMISQGRLSAARTVQLLLPIIDALAVAHTRGIVHRDLKPDNIMIAQEQLRVQPKILDFGIAKLTDPRDSDHKLTEIGMVVGSPDYMSPEQARGRDDVDAGSDIWAICVVLYEAVTGVTPFHANNYNALLRAIVEDEPKSLVEQAAGDSALWDIVRRGLAKNRADRQPSMSELGRALAGWLVSHGVFEDACGTSIESKWFGRNSDHALGSGDVPSSGRAGADFQPQLTHQAHPQGTGIDSPPYTATIRARSGSRIRTVRTVVGACALLALLLFGFTRGLSRGPAARPSVTAQAAAQTVAVAQTGTAEPAAAVEPSAALVAPTEASAAPAAAEPKPLSQQAKPASRSVAARPATASTHSLPPSSRPATAPPSPATPSSQPQAAKPAERPLDLLAPY
jgi:eukaryotic-like serine/threonine-protein kinase